MLCIFRSMLLKAFIVCKYISIKLYMQQMLHLGVTLP